MNVISESIVALENTDWAAVDKTIARLARSRDLDEMVFCVGNGGGAAHAMHFAADLRKIAGIKAISFDSIPEMTARINDDGWERAWHDWRKVWPPGISFMFSVGGQMDELSYNLPYAPFGIVGAKGRASDRIVVPSTSTPVIEGCQAVIAHHIVEQLCS